jgi:hypothetical protein
MNWRKITADQYRTLQDPTGDGYDEAFFRHPETGTRHELWDCGIEQIGGKVALHYSAAHPALVDPDHAIEVR